nr:polysaccharide biosynthesis C-terminal domain-containing protein [Adonisia turfae]
MFVAISLLLWLSISIFSQEILWIVTSPQYYPASKIILFLVPSVLFSGMYIFAPGISLAKKNHFIFWINFLGAILNTLLNWLFIPKFGFVGAAVATLLGTLFVFCAYIILSQRFYYIPYNWNLIGVSTISISIGCFLGYLINFEIGLNIFLKSFTILFYALFLLSIKLVSVDEIQRFVDS